MRSVPHPRRRPVVARAGSTHVPARQRAIVGPVWRQLAVAGVVLSLSPLAATPAFAANCTFTPAAGNWNLAGNWSCGEIPNGPTNDNATINVGSTVTIDSAQSIDALANAGLIEPRCEIMSPRPSPMAPRRSSRPAAASTRPSRLSTTATAACCTRSCGGC